MNTSTSKLALFLCTLASVFSTLNGGRDERQRVLSLKRHNNDKNKENPLLVLMLDGFRWDYVDRLRLYMPGFAKFLEAGVQADWVEPVFPVLSYPSWTSISTGVYPETHGIIGNFMVDLKRDPSGGQVFNLNDVQTTLKPDWWQNSEPIWITASKRKKRSFLRFWSRCDVPFHGFLPEECVGYYPAGGVQAINDTLKMALGKLRQGFQLVMVYGEHIDNVGHQYGPDSYEMQLALRQVDQVFLEFLQDLEQQHPRLNRKTNIIIVSDHGMTNTGPNSRVKYLSLEDYIHKEDVFRAVDSGSIISIAPARGRSKYVYNRLKKIPGVNVYRREEIPDSFHYKNSSLVLDILLLAKPGYAIHGLQSSRHIPRGSPGFYYWGGLHGYTPKMRDQRSIFFARGPAFKKNLRHSPIKLVDIYQMFAHCLQIPPQAHNGTWSNVQGMLRNKWGKKREGRRRAN